MNPLRRSVRTILAALVSTPAVAQGAISGPGFSVPSHAVWFSTPIMVKAGETLDFTARGTWWDLWIPCSADGYPAGLFYALGVAPRVPDDHRYFRLMGRIGDPASPPSTDTPLAPQGPDATFVIGRHALYTSMRAGRLYVFANDHDGMYWNNWGSVQLTVTRKDPSATTRTSP